jgi:hypothetical protein
MLKMARNSHTRVCAPQNNLVGLHRLNTVAVPHTSRDRISERLEEIQQWPMPTLPQRTSMLLEFGWK